MATTTTPHAPGSPSNGWRTAGGAGWAAVALTVAALVVAGCTIESASAKAEPLELGDCLLTTGTEGDLSRDDVVPCEDLHDWEIYHVVSVDPGTARPDGLDAVSENPAITDACLEEALRVVDLTLWEQGQIEFQLLLPNQELWDAGIEEVYCVVDSVGEPRAGSVLLAD